jgi:hypothetical protein
MYEHRLCVISGFRREVGENCALLGYYAPCGGNFLPTFRDNLSVSSSGFKYVRNVLILTDVSGPLGLILTVQDGKKCVNFYRRFGTTYRSRPQGSSR